VSELGPAAAAVAVQRRLNTATMLKRTRSRRVRTRGSWTCPVADPVVERGSLMASDKSFSLKVRL
jgi:hypothetical protein